MLPQLVADSLWVCELRRKGLMLLWRHVILGCHQKRFGRNASRNIPHRNWLPEVAKLGLSRKAQTWTSRRLSPLTLLEIEKHWTQHKKTRTNINLNRYPRIYPFFLILLVYQTYYSKNILLELWTQLWRDTRNLTESRWGRQCTREYTTGQSPKYD